MSIRRITDCERRYSMDSAASQLSLSRATIKRAIQEGISTAGRSGIYPVEQLGNRKLIPASSLDKWIRSYRLSAPIIG